MDSVIGRCEPSQHPCSVKGDGVYLAYDDIDNGGAFEISVQSDFIFSMIPRMPLLRV